MKTLLDYHLVSADEAETKEWKDSHLRVNAWLTSNLERLKSQELLYGDYVTACHYENVSKIDQTSFEKCIDGNYK